MLIISTDVTHNEFIREPSITRCRTLWHNAVINKRVNAFASNTIYMSICRCFILLEATGEHDSGWQLNTDLIFKRQNLSSSVKCYWFNYKMLMEMTFEKPNSTTASLGLFVLNKKGSPRLFRHRSTEFPLPVLCRPPLSHLDMHPERGGKPQQQLPQPSTAKLLLLYWAATAAAQLSVKPWHGNAKTETGAKELHLLS